MSSAIYEKNAVSILSVLDSIVILVVIETVGKQPGITLEEMGKKIQSFQQPKVYQLMEAKILRRYVDGTYHLNSDMPEVAKAVILAIWPEFCEQFPSFDSSK